MKNILKKISIIFGCLGLVSLFSIPCVLALDCKDNVSQTNAVDFDEYSFSIYQSYPGGFFCFDIVSNIVVSPSANNNGVNITFDDFYIYKIFVMNENGSGFSCDGDFLDEPIITHNQMTGITPNYDNHFNVSYYVNYAIDTSIDILNFRLRFGGTSFKYVDISFPFVDDLSEIQFTGGYEYGLGVLDGYYYDGYLSGGFGFDFCFDSGYTEDDVSDAYTEGYDDGYKDGTYDGYEDGYSVGYDEASDLLQLEIDSLTTSYNLANSLYIEYYNLYVKEHDKYLQLIIASDNAAERIESLENQLASAMAITNTFNLISSSFTGLIPLLDLELAPNITIGMLLTIPFTISIIVLAFKMLG